MEELAFRIGRSQGETVKITYLRSEHDCWAEFHLDAVLSPFRCSYRFHTQGDDVPQFARELRQLHETLDGTASFSTIEYQVMVNATIDTLGHITWKIELYPGVGGPRLVAEVIEDQSMLPSLLEELDAVVVALRRDRAQYETKAS